MEHGCSLSGQGAHLWTESRQDSERGPGDRKGCSCPHAEGGSCAGAERALGLNSSHHRPGPYTAPSESTHRTSTSSEPTLSHNTMGQLCRRGQKRASFPAGLTASRQAHMCGHPLASSSAQRHSAKPAATAGLSAGSIRLIGLSNQAQKQAEGKTEIKF